MIVCVFCKVFLFFFIFVVEWREGMDIDFVIILKILFLVGLGKDFFGRVECCGCSWDWVESRGWEGGWWWRGWEWGGDLGGIGGGEGDLGGISGGEGMLSLMIFVGFFRILLFVFFWLVFVKLLFELVKLIEGLKEGGVMGKGGEMEDVESFFFLKGVLMFLRDILLGEWNFEGMVRLLSVFVGCNRFLWWMWVSEERVLMDGIEEIVS